MIRVAILPPQLPASPYMDRLYGPFAQLAPDIELRRGRPRSELLGLLLGRGPRILHLHFFDELTQRPGSLATARRSLAFVLLLLAMRLRGVKLIWTAHNSVPHELYHPRWASFVYRTVVRWSSVVITHSEAARDVLVKTLDPHPPTPSPALQERGRSAACAGAPLSHCDGRGVGGEGQKNPIPHTLYPPKYVVIPHGSYIGHYGPIQERRASRVRLGLAEDKPVTLCIGALRPYKNLEGLIKAFASLPEHERGTLLIAGWAKDQAYARHLQLQAETVPGLRIELRYIEDHEMPSYLGAADLVALPYQRLLTSGVLLLALSYARPVLAPDLPSVRELIRDGQEGFLFAPDNPTTLSETLRRALQSLTQTQLEEQTFARAAQFPWEQSAALLAELYRKL